MNIGTGNTIKAYSTDEIIEELKQRGLTDTILIEDPSISYYVSVPALNKNISGCTNGLTKEKVLISVIKIK